MSRQIVFRCFMRVGNSLVLVEKWPDCYLWCTVEMQYLNDFSVMWNRKEARDAETNARYS